MEISIPRWAGVLAFTRKVTPPPTKITAADTDAVFGAGWNDRALYDAVATCALFNLMNRFVNGLGVEVPEAHTRMAAQWLAQNGYAQSVEFLRAPE